MWKSDHAFQEPFKLCGSKEGRGFLLFFELKTIRPSNRSYNFRITIQAKPDLVPSLLINVYPTRKWFIDILVWSQFYSTHKLYERAMQFCVSHFRELCVLQEWTELETVDIDLFLRVNQEVADLLPESNGTADQPRAEPHEELINSSQIRQLKKLMCRQHLQVLCYWFPIIVWKKKGLCLKIKSHKRLKI
jgi:hypothetical protein